jgi:thioredoxin reductase (NADPH)
MTRLQIIVSMLLLAVLLAVSLILPGRPTYGAVPGLGWIGLAASGVLFGAFFLAFNARSCRERLLAGLHAAPTEVSPAHAPRSLESEGPAYPHPVINVQTCIGCHACVDACPHDVLAIVNGKATPIAVEQCMEDTSCQVECPTVPKSCIVVNTTKKIPNRKVPQRDPRFMTNVAGIYLIGDVSGVPLIKNAINEGGAVIDYIVDELRQSAVGSAAEYDVAIIGAGPAGLSATAIARQRGLKYLTLEREKIAATIQQGYPAKKYIFFNPTDQETRGGMELSGPGAEKEVMLSWWQNRIESLELKINEGEKCKSILPADECFVIRSEQEASKQEVEYRVRRVVLAIGNNGDPMNLKVAGERLKILVRPTGPLMPAFCGQCGTRRIGEDLFCQNCGFEYVGKVQPSYEDDKVKYRLTDPNAFRGKHCLVIGAGNSAIEAAIDLATYRSRAAGGTLRWRDNTVSLVVRSDLKGDLRLDNKMLLYECIDAGRIKAYFGMAVKEITPTEVALMSAREIDPKTARETARFTNDYVFALIGSEKPTKFLESVGIKIG